MMNRSIPRQARDGEQSRTILVLAVVVLWAGTAANARYSGGTGEPNDPYKIATAEDLNDIGNYEGDWDKHFILINDVNLAEYTGEQFKIIGNYTTKFTGVFDGNKHKIWNFTWASTGRNYIGLFGCVGKGGQIKNLGMENVDFNAGDGPDVGGLVGYNYYGTIDNCYSSGNISGSDYVGGLVGKNLGLVREHYEGTIINCHFKGNISESDHIGGLVGENLWDGMISDCYSTGSVSGTGDYVGGLVACNGGEITNCYSSGSVSGKGEDVGGLVGHNYGTIINCHSSSSVSGGMYIGGLVQYNGGTIINCYSTGTVVGESEIGGLVAHNEGTITGCYSRVTVLSNEDCVGGLVGKNLNGTVANCYTTGSVSATGAGVGGVVGENEDGIITNCYSSGSVDGSWDFVGGLAGDNFYGTITNCYSTASVTGGDCVGGLVGGNAGTISSCYSSASVSGGSGVGGLVGQNGDLDFVYPTWNEIPGYIYNCYSTGEFTGSSNVGGLVGVHIAGEVRASFWDVETSDCNTSAGGIGKTTAEMKTRSTFTDAGWDFIEVWGIGENQTYPYLRTEPAGDSNHDKKVDLAILASHWLEGP